MSVQVLEIWLDLKLQWSEHIKIVLGKIKIQINALICTTASTWGTTFASMHQIYSTVVRSALIYEVVIWHLP